VCLRKLHHFIGFDVLDRYENFAEFHHMLGFHNEAEWDRLRMESIQGG
jgi:hypothetical protein